MITCETESNNKNRPLLLQQSGKGADADGAGNNSFIFLMPAFSGRKYATRVGCFA